MEKELRKRNLRSMRSIATGVILESAYELGDRK